MSIHEQSLVRRINSGEQNALGEFLELSKSKLIDFIRSAMSRSLATKIEPCDILQETSMSALQAIAAGKLEIKDPYRWLCHLAKRRIIDAHRRYIGSQKRSIECEIELERPINGSSSRQLIDVLATTVTTPTQALRRYQYLQAISRILFNMPVEQREVLQLRFDEALSIRQISEKLGKSNGAVRVTLSRALAKVRAAMK